MDRLLNRLSVSRAWPLLLLVLAAASAAGCAPDEAPVRTAPAPSEGSVPGTESPREGATSSRLEIVDRAIAFHGGELYRTSETELDVCSKSGCFHLRARLDGDHFEYDVSGVVSGVKRRVLWTSEGLQLEEDSERVEVAPEDEQALEDWVMARVYFPFLPYRLNDPGVYKVDLGLEEWDGRALRKVKVTFEPGSSTDADDEYLYWFDPETGRVEQLAYSFHTGYGGLRFRRSHHHRRVGGLLFFDQENLGINGEDFVDVDLITPAFVEERLETISTVRLENIEVRPLE